MGQNNKIPSKELHKMKSTEQIATEELAGKTVEYVNDVLKNDFINNGIAQANYKDLDTRRLEFYIDETKRKDLNNEQLNSLYDRIDNVGEKPLNLQYTSSINTQKLLISAGVEILKFVLFVALVYIGDDTQNNKKIA